ncbi:MAG: DUF3784 domain-containing protein [Oscillospiraceae bacterium]|jgi:cell division protein FtsW (lipid II flippase)|nr:DUF3784 domain-containing protein [Oscillospiraceae bacterium]
MDTTYLIADIAIGGVCALLLALALVLLSGRGAMMIAGYNTMRKEERGKLDEKALGRFVGWLLIALIPCMLLVLVGVHFLSGWLIGGGIAAAVALPIAGVVYANTGERFKKKD